MDALERWAAIMALPEYDEQLHDMAVLLFKEEQLTVAQIQGTLAAARRCAPSAGKVETPENYDAYRARMADGAEGLAGAQIRGGLSARDTSSKAQWSKTIAKVNAERGARA